MGDRQFVRTLARVFVDDAPPERLAECLARATAGMSSWRAVERLLQTHSCSALAYSTLTRPGVAAACGVPDETVERLRAHYQATFVRLYSEVPIVRQALAALTEAGVSALVIKGFAVGVWLYQDPVHREHGDVDLLVRESDEPTAHRVLTELGYNRIGLTFEVPPPMPGVSLESATYVNTTHRGVIDLSFDPLRIFWKASDAETDPFNGWWTRRRELAFGGCRFPTLGAEDQFIQLARHLQHHAYFRVNWFVDLMLLLRKHGTEMDWDLVRMEARRHSLLGGLTRTLEIMQEVFEFSPPAAAIAAMRSTEAERLLHRRIWPATLALGWDQPSLVARPTSLKWLSPQGPSAAAGFALFLLDQNRLRNLKYMGRRLVPDRAWLDTAYKLPDEPNASYRILLMRYWGWLLRHRREVRNRARTLQST